MTYQKVVITHQKRITDTPHKVISDRVLIDEGTRPPLLDINFDTFRKTPAEREIIKEAKANM